MLKGRSRRVFPRVLMLALPAAAIVVGGALAAAPVHKTVDVVPSASNTAVAKCTHGKVLSGFGFLTTMDPSKGVVINKLDPQRKAMRSTATNIGLASGQVRSIAYCAAASKRHPNPAPKTVKKTRALGDHATVTATATCPRRTSVRFGGFSSTVEPGFGQKAVIVRSMKRTSSRKWAVTARNEGAEPGSLTAIARCGRLPKLKVATESASLTDLGGGDNTATATCPGKRKVVMAGFTDLDDTESGIYLNGLDQSAHTVTATTFSFGPADLTAIAYCR